WRPQLAVRDSAGGEHLFMVARTMTVHASWWQAIRGRLGAYEVVLDQPTFTVAQESPTTWRMPAFRPQAPGARATKKRTFHVLIHQGRFRAQRWNHPAITVLD